MATIQKRGISLLLVLVLILGMIPSISAAEIDTQPSTELAETIPPVIEDTLVAETDPLKTTQSEDIFPFPLISLDNSSDTPGETKIIGQPNAFGRLFLINGGIDIPSYDHIQHKNHLPLYSVYLKNQPGYENSYYVAYCIEPGVVLGESGGHSGSSATIGGMTDGTGALERLSREQVEAMGVVLMYGQREIARRADAESVRLQKLRRHAAKAAHAPQGKAWFPLLLHHCAGVDFAYEPCGARICRNRRSADCG